MRNLPFKTCHLCGLQIGRSKASKVVHGETLHFCCRGCLAVFEILFNRPEGVPIDYRETDLYRACVESGIIPKKEKEHDLLQAQITNKSSVSSQQIDTTLAQDLTFRVGGMWCTACAWLVEEILRNNQRYPRSQGPFPVRPHPGQISPSRFKPSGNSGKGIETGVLPIPFPG